MSIISTTRHSGRLSCKVTPRLALMALFGGAVAIGFAPIFVRLSQVGPSATAFWRLFLAIPPLWLWTFLEGPSRENPAITRSPTSSSEYTRLIGVGLFFAGDLAVWHWSLKFTSVANATLLANFAPIFVTLGSWLFFSQQVRLAFLLAMGSALAGTVLLVGTSFTISMQNLWGDVLGIITAVFYAGYILTVKNLRARFSTATIMAWSAMAASAALLPVAILFNENLFPSVARGWFVLIALALLSHVGGQSLIAYSLAHLSATFSSVGLLVQPMVATILAWLILNEAIGPWQALGGVMVLLGIFAARRTSNAS